MFKHTQKSSSPEAKRYIDTKKPAGQADGARKKCCYASLLIGLLVGYDFHGDMGKKWVLVGHGLRESIGFYDM